MAETDQELLAKYVSRRDAEAFRALVHAHRDMVYAACHRVLGVAADAEDAAQNCFLTLARKPEQVKGSVAAWLHRVAVNCAIDLARQNRAREAREAAVMKEDRDPGCAPSWQDVATAVDAAIEELPDELRIPIIRHYLEARTQSDIAGELEVTQATVSKRLQRGTDELRERLRRAGVTLSAALLVSLLSTSAAEAAPATLTAALGKMALAGESAAGKAAAIGKGISLVKIVIIAGALTATITGAVWAVAQHQPAQPAQIAPVAAPVAPASAATQEVAPVEKELSGEELYGLMFENAQLNAESARGVYVKRSYSVPDTSEAAHLARVKQVDEVMASIAKSYAAQGATAEYEGKAAAMREEMLHQQEAPRLTTVVEKYYVLGKKYRVEISSPIESDEALDDIVKFDKWRSVKPDTIIVWNGTVTKMLTLPREPVVGLLQSMPREINRPKFLVFGRDEPVDPKKLLPAVRMLNGALTASRTRASNGEPAWLLELGHKSPLDGADERGAYTVLPQKGYCATEIVSTTGGKVRKHEEYDHFVKTSAGFWVPLHAKVEEFTRDKAGVATGTYRTETLAVEPPEVNIELAPELFELTAPEGTQLLN